MENSIKKSLKEEVAQLSREQLWDYWEGLRNQKKQIETAESIIKERLIEELGENDSLTLKDDAGVFWRTTSKYEVSISDAENIIGDQDLLSECVKVDLKKAKEVLPKELYIELEGKRKIVSENKILITGKIKE